MHLTSNPNFAFHDDVLPAFAKNVFRQQKYPQSASSIYLPYPKTIIPDAISIMVNGTIRSIPFIALEDFEHISTFELKMNGTEKLEIQLDLSVSKLSMIFFISS